MSFREFAGATSGALLGYITAGSRGARIGWKYGRKVSQNSVSMPPVKRKGLLTPNTPNKRIKTMSSSGIGKRLFKVVRRVSRNKRMNDGTVIVRRPRKKGQKRKKVKVSRKLRDKIKKVMENKAIQGFFQETSYQRLSLPPAQDNKQNVARLVTTGDVDDAYFSPQRVMDAASCLWNEKVQSSVGKVYADADNFDNKKLKVKVINSSTTFNFRNNTQRGLNLKVIEAEPKSNQVQGSLFLAWQNALTHQASTQGPNQSSITISELHTNPGMLPDMRRLFNFSTSKYRLEPGAECTHFTQGPQDKLYDFQKFWNGSTPQLNIKGSKFVLVVYYPDLVTTDFGDAGRYINDTAGQDIKYGLVCEHITRYHMEMPELTGFVAPVQAVVGDTQQLGQRQFSYAFKTYSTAQAGSINSVLNENPISVVSNPVS